MFENKTNRKEIVIKRVKIQSAQSKGPLTDNGNGKLPERYRALNTNYPQRHQVSQRSS